MLKNYIFYALALLLTATLQAQTPSDLQFVPKGNLCPGITYGYSTWTKYWEGENLRENGNVGTVSRQQITLGFNLGITDRLNVIVQLPYLLTSASQGTLNGQQGLQDVSLYVKAKYLEKTLGPGQLVIGSNAGFSTPVSEYLVDFAPLNLGTGTTNLSFRQMLAYQLDRGFFAGLKGNYTYRSNIPSIHRDFYFDQGAAHYGNEVRVYDVFDWTAALGYVDPKVLAEIDFNAFNCLGGADIRTWDPGFPSNNTDFSTLTGRFDYFLSPNGGLNFSLLFGYTLSGRNAGQSAFGSFSVNYLFPIWGK